MATTTTNYGLTKPATTDNYDIGVPNGNMDKIDTELKKGEDHRNNASVHIVQLTCTTSGAVHALTGLTATAGIVPCVFKADANYAVGNTLTFGGTAYTVVTSGGEALRTGAFLKGDIVGVKLDIDAQKLYIRQDSAAQVGLDKVNNTPDANKSVNYANSAGTASYAHYPSHAVGLADFGLRGNYISSASPSGGNDGDTWDQV